MSYSFTVRAASKALAKQAVAAKLAEVAHQQACHERDKAQAQAAADAFVDLLSDQPGKDVVVNMSGYLSGVWQGSDVESISSANLQVSASLAGRPADAV